MLVLPLKLRPKLAILEAVSSAPVLDNGFSKLLAKTTSSSIPKGKKSDEYK